MPERIRDGCRLFMRGENLPLKPDDEYGTFLPQVTRTIHAEIDLRDQPEEDFLLEHLHEMQITLFVTDNLKGKLKRVEIIADDYLVLSATVDSESYRMVNPATTDVEWHEVLTEDERNARWLEVELPIENSYIDFDLRPPSKVND